MWKNQKTGVDDWLPRHRNRWFGNQIAQISPVVVFRRAGDIFGLFQRVFPPRLSWRNVFLIVCDSFLPDVPQKISSSEMKTAAFIRSRAALRCWQKTLNLERGVSERAMPTKAAGCEVRWTALPQGFQKRNGHSSTAGPTCTTISSGLFRWMNGQP